VKITLLGERGRSVRGREIGKEGMEGRFRKGINVPSKNEKRSHGIHRLIFFKQVVIWRKLFCLNIWY
jgi:hypothetical protein